MVTEYTEICAICGKPKQETHHLVFGISVRKIADKDNLTIPLCKSCHDGIHNNAIASSLSKMLGQLAWEKEHGTREEFRERYGRSYL